MSKRIEDPSHLKIDIDTNDPYEQLVAITLQELLCVYAKKIAEGNNGIIFEFDTTTLPVEMKKILGDRIILNSSVAIKLLKVYANGKGKKEFEMQKKAFEIVTTHAQDGAQIPEPLLYRDIKLNDKTKELLRNSKMKCYGDRAEILIMDLIKGSDLATIILREVVQRHPESRLGANDYDNIEKLLAEVSILLEFETASSVARSTGLTQKEADNRMNNQNANKVYAYLLNNGFVMHPNIIVALRKTLNVLHDHGIVHRDAHERNIMISGQYTADAASVPNVFLIDFGSSVEIDEPYESAKDSIYTDAVRDAKLVRDEFVLTRLSQMAGTISISRDPYRQQWKPDGLAKRLLEQPKIKKIFEEVSVCAESNPVEALNMLFKAMRASSSRETDFDYFLVLSDALLHEERISISDFKEFINTMTWITSKLNKINRMIKSIG